MTVGYEVREEIAYISFNRPEKHNALRDEHIDELAVGDPIEFSLACVEHQLPDMLRHCGVDELADTVAAQPGKVDAAVAEVRELMEKARYPVA